MGFLDFFSGKKKQASKEEPAASKHFQTFFEQGRIELESRSFDKACEYFDKALAEAEKTKTNPVEKALVYKARELDGLGKYDESEKAYDRAFELAPDDPYIWFLRGVSYAEQGMHEKALRYYEKAFELNPLLEDAMLAKATLHGKLGHHDKQIESYQRILHANPDNRKAREQLQKLHEERKKQTNRQWLGGITKGIKLREDQNPEAEELKPEEEK
jgi:tetratricopeptide (TPR) repeat protein